MSESHRPARLRGMIHHDRSDADLMGLVDSGDESAFGVIFRRHESAVYGLALSIVHSPEDAEEVVGSAFLELWRQRGRARFVEDSARPWLMVTVSHLCRNSRRGSVRYGRLLAKIPLPDPVPDDAEEIARVLDHNRESREIYAALRNLREAEAAVVILCMIEELSMPEAARVLGLPLGTVKSRLFRAKSRMQRQLEHLRFQAEATYEG